MIKKLRHYKDMKRRAFTLIEIMVTIAIIGVLVSLTGYVYSTSLKRSRDYQRISDLQTIKNSLEQFYLDNRYYPQIQENSHDIFVAKWQLEKWTSNGCSYDATKKFLAPNYIQTIPEDPRVKMTFPGEGSCDTPNTGSYIYTITGREQDKATPRGYYLMAKMERVNFASPNTPTTTDLSPYGTLFDIGGVNGFKLCDATDFENSACSHNFYLSNKNR